MAEARGAPWWRNLPRPLRWLAVAAGAALALLLALLLFLALATNRWIRPLVEEQASLAIPGEVRIDGLDVSLLGLSVTLRGLAVLPEAVDAKPVIEVEKLHVSLARLPLLRRRLVVNQIEIEAPTVRVVREASGELDLLKVLLPETPAQEAAPETPPPAPIPVLLRRVVLGTGRIEFVDRAQPGAEPLTIEIPRSQIDDVVVTGDPGEGSSEAHLEIRSEGASVDVGGSFHRAADHLDVDATVELSKLPLARARVYLPDLGWTEFTGELDAKLHYVHTTGKIQTADGSAELRGLRIGVPKLTEPALAVESLAIALDQLDLLGRRLALGKVTLTKPRVFFDPANPANLPLLPKGIPSAGEPAAAATPPFAWSLGGLEIEGAQLVPIGDGLEPLTLDASVEAIASASPVATAVTLTLGQAHGSLALKGSACADPPGFRGKVTFDALALPPLLRVALPGAGVQLVSGVANGELGVKLGSLAEGEAPAPGGDLHLDGTLALTGLEARAGDDAAPAAKIGKLDVAIGKLELPGLLPLPDGAQPPEGAGRLRASLALSVSGVAAKSGKEGEFGLDVERLEVGVTQLELPALLGAADAKPEPVRIALDRVRVVAPKLRLTRGESGILLPELPQAENAGPAQRNPAATAAARETKAAKPALDTAENAGIRLELASLALEGGSLRFVDRTLKPFYQGDVTGLTLAAKGLAYPELRASDASLELEAPGPAPLWALGAYTPASSWFELNLERLPLAPLNPYVRNASGYVVGGGELSLYSKGSVTNGRLSAANWVTLFDPELSGGGPDAPLEKALGVPVSLAISLLKDPSGDIGLSIPIDYDEKGASVRLGSVIGSAVKGVLIGALTSPLKLLGAVVDASGRVKDATPEPVHFVPGRVELAAGDDERVAALAKLAATRPGLALRLSGQTSGADAQLLREARLLEAIDSGEGLPEAARGLAQVLVRRRLRAALEARLAGEPAPLEPEDAQRLDTWLAGVEIAPDALADLARRRAARVQELLQSQFGLDAKQILLADPGPPGGSPEPSVDVAIGS